MIASHLDPSRDALRIAHIVNSVGRLAGPDLLSAQQLTFETMRRSRALCAPDVRVDLFVAASPPDFSETPDGFTPVPALDRSVLDASDFLVPRNFPFIRDILDRLYAASDAPYHVYTNVDIALMPTFYSAVAAIIREGTTAFVINRRDIAHQGADFNRLPWLYAQLGSAHPGHDCFVWRRSTYPAWNLARLCLGAPGIGKGVVVNQVLTDPTFKEFTDLHLTFHLGSDRRWLDPQLDDYRRFNRRELERVLAFFAPDPANVPHSLLNRIMAR